MYIGRDVYHVNDYYTHDEMRDEGRTQITAKMKLGTLLYGWQILIKGAFASFYIYPGCNANLILSKFKMPFIVDDVAIEYIYGNTKYASEDNYKLFPDVKVLTSRRRFLVREWAVAPEIVINGGACSLSTMGLETVEV